MDTVIKRLKGDTGRLAATYLVIIISLTVVFSAVIYAISSSQFDRPLSPHSHMGRMYDIDDVTRSGVQQLFDERADQARTDLLVSLIILNLVVLIGGAFFSYYMARKTLEPIEAAMEAQAQFVSDASHELRTPLTALQITNEVALRKKKLTLAEAKDLIGHNLAETIKLRSLSDALLGLARQDTAETSRARLNLAVVILDVVQTLMPLADSRHITVKHEVPALQVTADQSALTQILRILLDNAIKYSPDGSSVAVNVVGDHDVTISIIDQGPGIAPEHQGKIFDRFYRVDESRSSNNVEGNGLGLAIAKSIADRNGYELHVRSTTGKGSTFSLVLPKAGRP